MSKTIRHCKLAACFKAHKSRISLHIGPGAAEAREAIHLAVAAKGHTVCMGRAPQGAMEDELGRWLEAMLAAQR